MKISHTLLSAAALEGLLDEFITRDSAIWNSPIEHKRQRVIDDLDKGRAVIVFNEEDGSTHILTKVEFDAMKGQKGE